MKCTGSIITSKPLCLLLLLFHRSRWNPSLYTSLWVDSVSVDFIFMIMLGSKENSYNFFPSVKSDLILQDDITRPWLLMQIMMKRVPNCFKTHKESEKRIYCKKVILDFYDFPATLYFSVVIAKHLIRPLFLHCIVGWLCLCRFYFFYDNARIKRN